MTATKIITNVRDVVRFHGTHSIKSGFPYEFWAALNDGDRVVMLALADWLEEHDDVAFAAGWRELYASNREPLHRGHDNYWLREGDTMDRSFLGYAWSVERLRSAAMLPATVFDVLSATDDLGNVMSEYVYPSRGPYHSRSVGRANAMQRAATAYALVAAGHKVTLLDENGMTPVWSVPVRYSEANQ